MLQVKKSAEVTERYYLVEKSSMPKALMKYVITGCDLGDVPMEAEELEKHHIVDCACPRDQLPLGVREVALRLQSSHKVLGFEKKGLL